MSKDNFFNNISLFFSGAFDSNKMSKDIIKSALQDEIDEFLFLCFLENVGITLPISYYMIELYPYLGDYMIDWEKKMVLRKRIWYEKANQGLL